MAQLDVPTWDWLCAREALRDSDGSPVLPQQHDDRDGTTRGVELTDVARELKLENGLVFAKILLLFVSQDNEPDLISLKTARTPVARLYNWSVLQAAMQRIMHVEIDMDTKALLVAGDTDVVLQLLNDVVARARTREERRKLGIGEDDDEEEEDGQFKERGGVEDAATDERTGTPPATPPSESEQGVNQLIAECLSRTLRLKHSRALRLASRAGALGTLLVNGLHGAYDSVHAFAVQLAPHSARLASLLASDPAYAKSVRVLLSTLSAGLVSRNKEVALGTAALLSELIGAFALQEQDPESAPLLEATWQWLVDAGAGQAGATSATPERVVPCGLQAVLACVEVRGGMGEAAFGVLDSVCQARRGGWRELLEEHTAAHLSAASQLDFLKVHVAKLAHSSRLGEDATVQHVLELATAHAAPSADHGDRARALGLAVALWRALPEAVEAHRTATKRLESALKLASRDSSLRLQTLAHTLLFELLEMFLQQRHELAQRLYRTLIFSLIEHHESEFLRRFINANMAMLLRRHAELPVAWLVGPLLRQLTRLGYNNRDFDFIITLARHASLEPVSDLPCDIRREGGQSLVMAG